MEGRTYRYLDGEPLFPFGFGLSYTRFEYSNLRFDAETVPAGEPVSLGVTLTNVGGREGDEVVQLYLRHENPPMRMPIRQLAGFKRVHLNPGESREVSFTIEAERMAQIDDAGESRVAPGTIRLSVGGSQPDEVSQHLGAAPTLTAAFELT